MMLNSPNLPPFAIFTTTLFSNDRQNVSAQPQRTYIWGGQGDIGYLDHSGTVLLVKEVILVMRMLGNCCSCQALIVLLAK